MGGQKSGAKGFAFFVVNVDLTEEGIEHVEDIVTAVFQVSQVFSCVQKYRIFFIYKNSKFPKRVVASRKK